MTIEKFDILPIDKWYPEFNQKPLIIAGPCSAESEEQVMKTAGLLAENNQVKVLRAGIWKPRTRPGTFQGIGTKGLKWLQQARKEFGFRTTVEVTTPENIEQCLKHDVDILWIGARSVANPVNVQALADSLTGINIPVMVKNPLHPDMAHWIGALERFYKAGITKLAAIHRGFYPFEDTRLRNIPRWEFPIELKRRYPNLPLICDPSHIAGKAEWVEEIAQKAMNLNMDGLMIETHYNPSEALSDARQQLKPDELKIMLHSLTIGRYLNGDGFDSKLESLREQLDSLDLQMIELLAQRMKVVERIGKYKCKNNLSVFQLRRWQKTFVQNSDTGEKSGLSREFVSNLISSIHMESIRIQNEIIESGKCAKKDEK